MNLAVENYLKHLYLCVYERMSSGIVVNQPFLRKLAEVYCSTIEFKEMGLFSCIPLCDVVLKPDCGLPCPQDCNTPVIVLPEEALDACVIPDPCPPCKPFVANYLIKIRPADTCVAPCFSTIPLPATELNLYPNNDPLVYEFADIVKKILPTNNCYCVDVQITPKPPDGFMEEMMLVL